MNNEDRELLEMAAKAAGYILYLHPGLSKLSEDGFAFTVGRSPWNPLVSDGDALRLAVELKLDVKHIATPECDFVRVKYEHYEFYEDYYGKDPYAATRRAITRAAAEIGKTLK